MVGRSASAGFSLLEGTIALAVITVVLLTEGEHDSPFVYSIR